MSHLKLTPAARADLDAIWDYTAQRWDIDQAETYIRALGDAMILLSDSPGLGRSIEDIRPGYLKFPTASHVIFYRRAPAGIEVIRILHKNIDVERHI
jgi:toxin ParE1/3/4